MDKLLGWQNMTALGLTFFVLTAVILGLRALFQSALPIVTELAGQLKATLNHADTLLDKVDKRQEQYHMQMLTELALKHREHEIADEQRHNRLTAKIDEQCASTRHTMANQVQAYQLLVTDVMLRKNYRDERCQFCGQALHVPDGHAGEVICALCKLQKTERKLP